MSSADGPDGPEMKKKSIPRFDTSEWNESPANGKQSGISGSQVALSPLGPGCGGFGYAKTLADKHSISTWKGIRTEPVPASFSSRHSLEANYGKEGGCDFKGWVGVDLVEEGGCQTWIGSGSLESGITTRLIEADKVRVGQDNDFISLFLSAASQLLRGQVNEL